MTSPAVATPAHAVPGMTFDDARLALRRTTLGASEIPAVAGFNPKRTALDVYLEKKGIVAPFAGNEYTEWGLRLESAIAQKYAEVKGVTLRTSDTVVGRGDDHVSQPWMSCTPDRYIIAPDNGRELYGLEIKRFGEYRADDFGVPGTADVPLDLAAQCLWSMMVTGLERWDVGVLIGQADFRIYSLTYDGDAANVLHEVGHDFWHRNVLPGVEPVIDGSKSAHKYLQQKYATHSAVLIDPTPELLDAGRELASLKAEIKALDSQKAALEHQIQNAIGDAAGIRNLATWKLDRTGRARWKDVAEALGAAKPEHAALVQRYTSAPSRRFRLLIEEE